MSMLILPGLVLIGAAFVATAALTAQPEDYQRAFRRMRRKPVHHG